MTQGREAPQLGRNSVRQVIAAQLKGLQRHEVTQVRWNRARQIVACEK